jgi:hypothetical protein
MKRPIAGAGNIQSTLGNNQSTLGNIQSTSGNIPSPVGNIQSYLVKSEFLINLIEYIVVLGGGEGSGSPDTP